MSKEFQLDVFRRIWQQWHGDISIDKHAVCSLGGAGFTDDTAPVKFTVNFEECSAEIAVDDNLIQELVSQLPETLDFDAVSQSDQLLLLIHFFSDFLNHIEDNFGTVLEISNPERHLQIMEDEGKLPGLLKTAANEYPFSIVSANDRFWEWLWEFCLQQDDFDTLTDAKLSFGLLALEEEQLSQLSEGSMISIEGLTTRSAVGIVKIADAYQRKFKINGGKLVFCSKLSEIEKYSSNATHLDMVFHEQALSTKLVWRHKDGELLPLEEFSFKELNLYLNQNLFATGVLENTDGKQRVKITSIVG